MPSSLRPVLLVLRQPRLGLVPARGCCRTIDTLRDNLRVHSYLTSGVMYIMYMSVEMSVSQARAELGPVTSRAEYNGEITFLLKHGHRAAAVVPAAVAELVEQVEDVLDGEAVAEVLAKLNAGTEESVPFVRRTRRQTA